MDEDRFVISNELWEKIAPMLPGKAGDPEATGHDNRLFIERSVFKPWVFSIFPLKSLPDLFTMIPEIRNIPTIQKMSVMESVYWRARTGVPWRDLPKAFGKWNTVFRRFRRWAKVGVFERLFNVINGEPDLEYAMIDGTIVQAHQKASGAKGGLSIRPSGALVAG